MNEKNECVFMYVVYTRGCTRPQHMEKEEVQIVQNAKLQANL